MLVRLQDQPCLCYAVASLFGASSGTSVGRRNIDPSGDVTQEAAMWLFSSLMLMMFVPAITFEQLLSLLWLMIA
jgi:hypothetical protein